MILNIAQQKRIASVSDLFIVSIIILTNTQKLIYTSVSQNGSKYLQEFQLLGLGGQFHNLLESGSQGCCYLTWPTEHLPLQRNICSKIFCALSWGTSINAQRFYCFLFSLNQSHKAFNHPASLRCQNGYIRVTIFENTEKQGVCFFVVYLDICYLVLGFCLFICLGFFFWDRVLHRPAQLQAYV